MLGLLEIELIRLRRNMGFLLLSIIMPVIFFLIFSSTVEMPNPDLQSQFVKAYMLTMTGFSMSGFGLFTFPFMLNADKKNHWLIYLEHSPLPLWLYYLAKVCMVCLCFVASITIVFAVGAGVRGVDMTSNEWLVSASLLLVCSSVFLAMGLLVSLIKSEQAISVISNLLYFILAIMGGSWMPITLFPKWVQDLCKLTPTYHVNHLVTSYALKGDFHLKSLLIVLAYAIMMVALGLFLKNSSEVK